MSDWIDFDYALIQLVPCVHRPGSHPVGVVLHAPTRRHIAGRFLGDLSHLEPFACDVDLVRVHNYLAAIAAVIEGTEGPLATLTASERFHWLTAPRSDILQPTPTHAGRSRDLAATLDRIFDLEVG